jgi:hypothetical protein
MDRRSASEPVGVGDVVYFDCVVDGLNTNQDVSGMLYGDGLVTDAVGLNSGRPSIAACIFQICPQLAYTAHERFAQPADSGKHDELETDKIAEAEKNAEVLANIETKRVRYGQIIQLRHMESSKFLTGYRERADNQRACYRIALTEECSSLAYFKMMPRFAHRSEGGLIYRGDKVQLQNIQLEAFMNLTTIALRPADLEPRFRIGSLKEVNLNPNEPSNTLSIGTYRACIV